VFSGVSKAPGLIFKGLANEGFHSVLTGGPIGGALLEYNGGAWYGLILFSSITLLFGAFLLLVARLVGNRRVLAVF